MDWLSDLLQGIPLNAVLRERVTLAEQKFKDMEEENKRLKQEVAELTKEKEGLKRRIDQIPVAVASPTETPAIKDGMYYKGEDGPFCTTCYDEHGKTIRLTDANDPERRLLHIRRKCPICKTTYKN